MPYRPVANPAASFPKVTRLVWKLERHYLEPAHSMFRLPLAHYHMVGNFQFSIAHLLLGTIAGFSTTLFAQTGKNGARFRGLLVEYYPFGSEPTNSVPVSEAARTLWSVFRNPLAHDLGFDLEKKAKTPVVKVFRVVTNQGRRGLTEKRIEALENTSLRPVILKPTLQVRTDATVLSVDALYWGVRRMVENLLGDTARVQAAEKNLPAI